MSEHARMYRSFSGGSFESLAGLTFVLTGTVIVSVDILASSSSFSPHMYAQGLVKHIESLVGSKKFDRRALICTLCQELSSLRNLPACKPALHLSSEL